jgi:aldose sugar dehydrogenase
LKDGKVVAEEKLLAEKGWRIRDVRSGPDGAIWALTDEPSGHLLQITP